MYGINGERRLVEWEADWLPGYENSMPVRIGNAASGQFQLDVFGEVAVALARTPAAEDDLRTPAMELEAALIDHLCKVWPLPDEGIWETRGGAKHFVHSKVMAWVALDRAVKQHERFDGAGRCEAVAEESRHAAQGDLREGIQQEAELVYAELWIEVRWMLLACGWRWWDFCRRMIRALWERSRRFRSI